MDVRIDVPSGALNAKFGGVASMQFDGPDHVSVYRTMPRRDELLEHRRALAEEHLPGTVDAGQRQVILNKMAELDALIAESGR